jgi:hypothetical protein
MKLLIKRIAFSRIFILFRNFIGFKPIIFNPSYKRLKNVSLSDAFPWRTDSGYVTIFRYADLLRLFSKIEESSVELVFFTKDNRFIKKIEISQLSFSNEIIINNEFLNGIQEYGYFNIFHRTNSDAINELVIANRCYLGFSIDGSPPSFVHGNSHVKFKSFDGEFSGSGMVLSSFFKNLYRIQNTFLEFDKSELFFVNPTPSKLIFFINNKKYILNRGCSILIDVSGKANLSIRSKCLFLRPTIFNYKNQFFDVYHS